MINDIKIFLCAQVRDITFEDADKWLRHNIRFADGVTIIDDGSTGWCAVASYFEEIIDDLAHFGMVDKKFCFVKSRAHRGKNAYHNKLRYEYQYSPQVWILRLDSDEFVDGITSRIYLKEMVDIAVANGHDAIEHAMFDTYKSIKMFHQPKRRLFANMHHIVSPANAHSEEQGFRSKLDIGKDNAFWINHVRTLEDVKASVRYNMGTLHKVFHKDGEKKAIEVFNFMDHQAKYLKISHEELDLPTTWEEAKRIYVDDSVPE